MKQDTIVFMTSPCGLDFYRANLTKEVVLKISRNLKTQPDFSLWEEIKTREKLVRTKKDKWRIVENNYYLHNGFDWIYEGNRYTTVNTPFGERQLQTSEGTPFHPIYPYLAFHNGQIWATCISGNYYPRMPLVRINKKGEREHKWTHVKNLRNFIKYRK